LRAELGLALVGAETYLDAKLATDAVLKQHADDPVIANALFVPMMLADLAGQLMVYTYEAGKPEPKRKPVQLSLGGAQPDDAFLHLPWEEALEEFRARGLVSDDELSTLLKDTAEQAGEARELLLQHVQERVYELLDTAIEDGQTFGEFKAELEAEAPGLGISTEDSAYLQNVFRTNLMSAYGAGRNRALNDPDVIEAVPYRQIRTAGDARVRDGEDGHEDHQQLDGLVFRADGPLKNLTTPLGFQCRCGIIGLSEWDGDVITELPPNSVAPGFGGI